LVDVGNYQILFAESEQLVVSLALANEIQLVLLFDPSCGQSLIDIKDFLRQRRRETCVRILPGKKGVLKSGWRGVISDALKPVKKPKSKTPRIHPRFSWKPSN